MFQSNTIYHNGRASSFYGLMLLGEKSKKVPTVKGKRAKSIKTRANRLKAKRMSKGIR